MTVEYSKGYIARARERLEQIERTLSPRARQVARELAYDFRNATSHFKQPKDIDDLENISKDMPED